MPLTAADKERITLHLAESRLNRDEMLDTLKVTHALIESIATTVSNSVFCARSVNLNATFTQFSITHGNIRSACVKLGLIKDYEADVVKFNEFQAVYFEIVAARTELEKSAAADAVLNASVQQRTIKLPEIQLPVFSGSLREWQHFFDTFCSLVHKNKSLAPIDKYHYLLSSTKGVAHTVVSTLPLTADNYETAWNALVDKYHDTRVLALHYLDTLLKLQPLTDGSYENLQKFYSIAHDNVHALNKVQIPDLANFILLTLLLRKVNSSTREKFELKFAQTATKFPNVDDLLAFLRERCQALEMSRSQAPSSSRAKLVAIPQRSFYTAENQLKCPHCHDAHRLSTCQAFRSLDVAQKRDVIRQKRLCFNCFSSSHLLRECSSKFTCATCHGKHHTLLHPCDDQQRPHPRNHEDHSQSSSSITKALSCSSTTTVLLGTAVARLKDGGGCWQKIRLMIDSGSQRSFITANCASRLHLPVSMESTPISGLGNSAISWAKGTVMCELQHRRIPAGILNTHAVVLPKITTDLPNSRLPNQIRAELGDLILADPGFDNPGPVDVLLGADLFPQILDGKKPLRLACGLSAVSTFFGWALFGKFKDSCPEAQASIALLGVDHLQTDISKFWQLEEPEVEIPSNPDDVHAEDHFSHTHYRTAEGRYVVALPFKNKFSLNFGQFGKLAHTRLFSLESRLRKNPSLQAAYSAFMQEYIALGHMTSTSKTGSYLIPHHCVYKNLQSLDKIRVVFDASARPFPPSPDIVSLNDALLVGPKLQKDVGDIVLNFRCHQIVFTADICKMYRQILVTPEDRKYQHILWRTDPGKPVEEYELSTVTYGLSCAPFLALRVLQQLASDERALYPRASQILLDDVYVDDIVTGADTLEDALELRAELIKLLSCAGFVLKKWTSNSVAFLEHVPEEDREVTLNIVATDSQSVKILGIQFEAASDAFTYRVIPNSQPATKRSVLSNIARIFDPLGWISPVVFFAKRLMQGIWRANLDWDDSLPASLIESWSLFQKELVNLSQIKIPRLILPLSPSRLTLVGFCDASECGYAAVVYLRTEDSTDRFSVSLLKSKTKVAPVNPLSIPRLELCAVTLLAKLVKSLLPFTTKLSISEFIFFTDSTIALAWLRTPPL